MHETAATRRVGPAADADVGADVRLRSRTFLRGASLVFAGTMVWQLSNFGFNAVAAHLLGPKSYGSLAAVAATFYLANPLFTAIQTVSSRITTTLLVRDEVERIAPLLRHYGLRLALAGGFVAGMTAILSNAVARFLRVPSGIPFAIVAVALLFWMVTHAQRGVLQGLSRFERYTVSTLTEAITKVVGATVVLVWFWTTVDGAVLAVSVSAVCAFVANTLLLRFLPNRRQRRRPQLPINAVRYSIATLGSLVLLALLLSVDVLAAKRYLPGHDAGLYAAVSLSGKIIYFATASLALVLFPVFSARHEGGRDARRALLSGIGVVAASSVVLIALYAVMPWLVIGPLFGSRYDAAGPYLAPIGIAFAFYGVGYLATMYLLSRNDASAIVVLALAVLAQLAGLYSFHGTIWDIIAVEIAVLAPTALALVALALRRPQLRVVAAATP